MPQEKLKVVGSPEPPETPVDETMGDFAATLVGYVRIGDLLKCIDKEDDTQLSTFVGQTFNTNFLDDFVQAAGLDENPKKLFDPRHERSTERLAEAIAEALGARRVVIEWK